MQPIDVFTGIEAILIIWKYRKMSICRLKSSNILYLAKSEAEVNNTSYTVSSFIPYKFQKALF